MQERLDHQLKEKRHASRPMFDAQLRGNAAMTAVVLVCLALALGALLMGTSFGHVLEMGPKLEAEGAQWLGYQHRLYRVFASVGGAIEIGALVAAGVAAWMVRDTRPASMLALMGFGLLAVAFFGVWIFVTNQVNRRTAAWKPMSLPADWRRWRLRWEVSHAVRFALQLAAFIALLCALVIRVAPRGF